MRKFEAMRRNFLLSKRLEPFRPMHFFASKMRENERNFRFFGCEVEILELNTGEKMKFKVFFDVGISLIS